jgi:hypothetical protein
MREPSSNNSHQTVPKRPVSPFTAVTHLCPKLCPMPAWIRRPRSTTRTTSRSTDAQTNGRVRWLPSLYAPLVPGASCKTARLPRGESVAVRRPRRFLCPPCNLLKARMIVTTYNQHVRLLSSEPFGWFAPPKSTRAWEPTLLWNHFTNHHPGTIPAETRHTSTVIRFDSERLATHPSRACPNGSKAETLFPNHVFRLTANPVSRGRAECT